MDRAFVGRCMRDVEAVLHAAALHKPHVAAPSRQDFVATNVTGTLNLLEEARTAGLGASVFTSTTSAFGRALVPRGGAPAAWITEDVVPVPLNVYEVTKVPAEDLCELFHRSCSLPCLILRTSCFFPEPADRRERHGWPTRISTRRPTSSCSEGGPRTSWTRTCSRSTRQPRSDSADTCGELRVRGVIPPSRSL